MYMSPPQSYVVVDVNALLIDWACLLQSLVKNRIKPWVNKKIVEYIGEEEPTLVDFICDKVSGLPAAFFSILVYGL